MRGLPVVTLALVGFVASGCGQSEAPPAAGAATTAAPASAQAGASTIPNDPVARVVYEFLDAVRQGDTSAASQRLTPLALQRTSEMDFVFAPPGSPTASFKVGNVEMVDQDKAVVDSVWTDLDADGKPQSEPTLWALRLTEGAWRISGMAAEMGVNQPLMVIDFENPETMAPPKPVDPANVAGPAGGAPGAQPSAEVARNPFEQAAPR
jgi:hypothetical protein